MLDRPAAALHRGEHPPGDLVPDPFVGAGTTARAARALHRRSVGIDLNPAYLELTARHLA